MNLLPFTLIFVLIISLSSLALFQGHATTSLSQTLFSAFMKAHVAARNEVEQDHFKFHLEKAPPEKKGDPRQPRNNKPYVSFRTKITDNSKFNLAPLFKENSILLQETLVRLVTELYGGSLLFKEERDPKLSEKLVREIVKAAGNTPLKDLKLTNIKLKNEQLNHIWYKMLRGTAEYDLSTHEGWPPFEHYAMIRQEELKAVCIKKASIPLLKSFVGDKAALKILERERQKYYDEPGKSSCLSQEEINPILYEFSLTDRMPFITYNYGASHNEAVVKVTDKDSGIVASIKQAEIANQQ